MRKESIVCGGRIGVKICARVLSEKFKSLDSKPTMTLEVHLVFWECSDASVCIKVNTNHLVII